MNKLLSIVALSLIAFAGLTGCEQNKSPTEKAGEALEKAGDKVEDAAQEAGDAVEDAGDKIKEATSGG